ncbi:MAG TPA: glycosyl hydrolase family 18 protein, partial [Sediminibacterium sp.]|nr:glycosyl hydrolase family 18 protein [Sediminibacterium sp.]
MSAPSSQVFQANNPSRWQRTKWGFRVFGVVLLLAGVVLSIALTLIAHENPEIPLEGRAIKKVLTEDQPDYRASELGRRYRGFRKLISDKWAKGRGVGQNNQVLNLSNSSFFSDSVGIRAAFYVNWDPQSFFSLRKNISKINLVLPEWFFVDPKADTLFSKMDPQAFDLIMASGVKVMPMLSNSYNSQFNGAALHRILNNPAKSERLIQDVVALLTKYNFAGINVDFEELNESRNEVLTRFQQKLYTALHAKGFLVTQNVSPFNQDYDYSQLAQYNDYLFLMAYDQHSESTPPGPICDQHWIQSAVNNLAAKVNPAKIVLNLAAFGYDWSSDTTQSLSYQEALTVARESEGKVQFDNDTYNLHYKYYDGDNKIHDVYFTDAGTNFNTLRFATEYGLAGTAIWRLGSEDNRLWDFYNLPMTKDALRHF